MTTKTASLSTITKQLNRLPARFDSAGKVVGGWKKQTLRMTKEQPLRALLGAFAIGFLAEKLARIV